MYWRTETYEEYRLRLTSWRKWFAWYPVKCMDRTGKYEVTAWLTTVYRKHEWDTGYDGDWISKYRTINTHLSIG